MSQPPRYDVLVVGGVGVDTTVRVRELPLPAAHDSVGVPPIRDYVGHTGNGVALGCHALGMRVKFVDFIGEDAQGEMVLAHYRERGLDFTRLVSAAGTRRSVNLIDGQGRRMSFYDGRHSADLHMPRDFYLPLLTATRHVHVSIMGWARELFPDIHAAGMPVSTDLHDWDGVQSYHLDFALQSDLVFLSTVALGGRTFETMRRILEEGRADTVVATAGAEGSYLLSADDAEIRHHPAVDAERPAVDSSGAGDAFAAAFIYGRLGGRSPWECMGLASVAGAHAVGSEGTHQEFIDASTLESALAALDAGGGRAVAQPEPG